MSQFELSLLPLEKDIESKKVLKKAALANKELAKLDGLVAAIPNQSILINALVLQEAKESSEIENIITTHDELYQAGVDFDAASREAKEVYHYREALLYGYAQVKQKGLLLKKDIVEIQKILEGNSAGIRTQSGTVLRNTKTGDVIYTPPQENQTIHVLLDNLERYINEPSENDPLVDMAIIHYQFESIHPFYDGNGRTGRILNILYLVLKELLEIPVLYLSRYIIRTKSDYYRLLQEVRTKGAWEEWILYMLDGVIQTSRETICIIRQIRTQMQSVKERIKEHAPKIYSKDLLELLFKHPYTKIEFVMDSLGVTRQTASSYLKKLESMGILQEHKIGRTKYFINKELFELLRKSAEDVECV